jgi:hypothetical protein
MKRAPIKYFLIYLLPAALLNLSGCVKTQRDPDNYFTNKGYPLGTFSGDFLRIHKNHYNYKYDTLRTYLKLTLSTNTGYMVTGDTITLHAGSYGSFSEDFANMAFDDITNAATSTNKKVHLSGFYTYDYDGTTLKITPGGKQPDTLKYLYILKKVN